jgi:hypothetical protein
MSANALEIRAIQSPKCTVHSPQSDVLLTVHENENSISIETPIKLTDSDKNMIIKIISTVNCSGKKVKQKVEWNGMGIKIKSVRSLGAGQC